MWCAYNKKVILVIKEIHMFVYDKRDSNIFILLQESA